jgi:hypothetical protein
MTHFTVKTIGDIKSINYDYLIELDNKIDNNDDVQNFITTGKVIELCLRSRLIVMEYINQKSESCTIKGRYVSEIYWPEEILDMISDHLKNTSKIIQQENFVYL